MKQYPQDRQLVENVRLLGRMLGEVLKKYESEACFQHIEKIRSLAKKCEDSKQVNLLPLLEYISKIKSKNILPIARAFLHFLNLANQAEQAHRIRRTRFHELQSKTLEPGSLAFMAQKLLQAGVSANKIFEKLSVLEIDLTFTAHPTEVMRRTLMQKFELIGEHLLALDRQDLTDYEKNCIEHTLQKIITEIWHTDEIRRVRPTPLDEVEWCVALVETTLWNAIPAYYHRLGDVCKKYLNKSIPIDITPIKFSTWMGADRDGNPNVTYETTEQACYMMRQVAAKLYTNEIEKLCTLLCVQTSDKKIIKITGETDAPYRSLLQPLADKLESTANYYSAKIAGKTYPEQDIITDEKVLLETLSLIYNSLNNANLQIIANAELRDLIWRVQVFGMQLTKMDIRQESTRHLNVVQEIYKHLGLGDFATLTETDKQKFLVAQLKQTVDIKLDRIPLTDESREVINTIQLIQLLPANTFQAYVISMAANASDILSVYWLQAIVGVKDFLHVVPLFETQKDLYNAKFCLDILLSNSWFRKFCNNKQQVMIGYSDSAKDVGLLAAAWAQYKAVDEIDNIAKKYKVKLCIFHGRGGSICRGGAPVFAAMMSQPPGSINGCVRVTQQGEVIRHHFAMLPIARRTLEIYTSSTLEATILPGPKPDSNATEFLNELCTQSKLAYQYFLKSPDFMPYFHSATPLNELSKLRIASRPASRKKSASLESLRAIPWVFAWTQNRLLLPSWLGLESALQYIEQDSDRKNYMQQLNSKWPFMISFFNLEAMVLAKVDLSVSMLYHDTLTDDKQGKMGYDIFTAYQNAVNSYLKISEQAQLVASDSILGRTIRFRQTYLLPLHVLQVVLLKQYREDLNEDLLDMILITVKGIAAGMKNTG